MQNVALSTIPEFTKVFVNEEGGAIIRCPDCRKSHDVQVSMRRMNKLLSAKCPCKGNFYVFFDVREYYRKEVTLGGAYTCSDGISSGMIVRDISKTGLSFTASRKHNLQLGDSISLMFALDDSHRTVVRCKASIRRIDGNKVGVEFCDPCLHTEKSVGFYLLH